MELRRGIATALATVALLAHPPAVAAKPLVIPPRPGQVGVSVQGEYGGMLKSGSIGEDFDFGPGLAVRIRYRMRYERGLGLSFESQSFEVRPSAEFIDPDLGPLGPGHPLAPRKVTVTLSGLDIYQMFGTRTTTTRMVGAGFGLAQTHYTLNDGETAFPAAPDGAYVSLGAGVEKFFYRSLAYDLSVRYMALFVNGSTNHDFQAALGLAFYAAY